MAGFAKHRIGGLTKYTGAVAGTLLCLQFVLWQPPAFAGILQDAQKEGERAAKETKKAGDKAAQDTRKAGDKALQDTQKSGRKAGQDAEKAAGKALRDTQKAGGTALQVPGKSLKNVFDGKKRGTGNSPRDPEGSGGGGGQGQGPDGGSDAVSSELRSGDGGQGRPGQGPDGGSDFFPSSGGRAGSGQGAEGRSDSTYSEPTSYPNEQRAEPKKAPEFSFGSTEPAVQGDKSWHEKLGISGLALPPGATGQENPEPAIPRGEQVPEPQGR